MKTVEKGGKQGTLNYGGKCEKTVRKNSEKWRTIMEKAENYKIGKKNNEKQHLKNSKNSLQKNNEKR